MSALRVLFLNHNVAFTGGGTFFIGLQIGDYLVRHGHRVTLLASSADGMTRFGTQNIKGVQIIQAPGMFPARWRYGYDPYETLRRMVWVGRQPRFDIVHALESRPTVIYPALVAKQRGARLVMHWGDWLGRGGAVEQRANPTLRALLRPLETYFEESFRSRADATTVINSALEERARRLGVAADTIMRLPHVADPESIHPRDCQTARSALGLPLDAPILGYVGALFADDATLLLDILARVRSIRPETRLLMIGNPKVSIAPTNGIIRTGFVSQQDMEQYLAACDVLCLPMCDTQANRGRYPSKIADYLAAGRCIVVSNVGDIATVVRDAQAGLVAETQAEDFARQVLVLLDHPEWRVEMGRRARRAAETWYSWATVAQRVEALYLKTSTK